MTKLIGQVVTCLVFEAKLYDPMLLHFLTQFILNVLRQCLVCEEPLLFFLVVSLIEKLVVLGTRQKHALS